MITKTLLVVDDESLLSEFQHNAITFSDYLRDYPKLNEPRIRVINLCDTGRYLSQGYYCSLLSEARQHQVVPGVKVINALRGEGGSLWLDFSQFTKVVDEAAEQTFSLIVCMGEVPDSRYRKLAVRVFQEFSAPILKISATSELTGIRVRIQRTGLSELDDEQRKFCLNVVEEYSRKGWRSRGAGKKYRWDMAILVDPAEKVPPSNKGAISRFVKAGEKLGIRVQKVAASELSYLNQLDALFIRETTAIDHHTYRLAREADENGLIVIDDPDSILRCCNKVFLHDAFNYQKVPSLQTEFLSDVQAETLDQIETRFGYPLILKMPEGSFSKGVFKVNNREDLHKIASDLLKDSALVLVQEYLFTDYDWRIGVLNGRALYACRYYMARNHWQIYNHGSRRHFSGGFDALPTFEVPDNVLKAALKAGATVGNGLYGIDIKTVDSRAYVLEVNDNPNIDHGVEDAYLGEELYMQIMSEFLRRLEARGR